VDYRHQLGIVRRWLPFLLLGLVVAAVPTYWLTSRQDEEYQATAIVLPERLLPASGPDFNEVSVSRLIDLSSTWAFMAKRPEVLGAVAAALKLDETPRELASRITTNVDGSTASLTIQALAGSDTGAADLANGVASKVAELSSLAEPDDPALLADLDLVRQRMREEYEEYTRLLAGSDERTPAQEARLNQKVALLAQLRETYDTLVASLNPHPDGLVVVETATAADTDRVAPRPLYFTVLAALAGLFAVAALAFVVEYLDDRLSTPGAIKEATGLATLGAIGRRGRLARLGSKYSLATLKDPRSGVAEAFRDLRTKVEVATSESPIKTLLVTSSTASEGKAITAANLAVAFAQAGRKVILIDADLRRPSIHTLFRIPNKNGLTSLARDPSVPLANVAHTIAQEENLRVLTAGPAALDTAAMLGSQGMRDLVKRISREADLLVFDSSSLQSSADAALLSSFLDRTLLVIDARRSRRAVVVDALQTLSASRANVLGAVLYRASRSYREDRLASRRAGTQVATALDRTD
jgi:non-specific protein-tyrosine kinase